MPLTIIPEGKIEGLESTEDKVKRKRTKAGKRKGKSKKQG